MADLHHRLRRTIGAALLAIACVSGAASAGELIISHARGETVLAATPRKVAVYDLATLDILNALGVDAIAGVPRGAEDRGNFPAHLEKYRDAKYRNIGTLFEPDIPALTALGPDLITIGGRSARKYDAVSGIAPTIDMSPSDKGLAAVAIANTRKLGEIFGVSDRASERIAALEALLARLHAQAGQAGTGLLLFAAGQGVTVHAPGDRFGTVYDFVGIRPAVAPAAPAASGPRPAAGTPEAEARRKQQQQAFTTALATDPTWLFVIDRTAATGNAPAPIAERLAADKRIAATGAWKAGRVVYLDPKIWYLVGAGIDSLTRSASATLATMEAVQE